MCSGKCPFTDIKKCGFNINWKLTDLEKIFFGRSAAAPDYPVIDIAPDDNTRVMEVDILFIFFSVISVYLHIVIFYCFTVKKKLEGLNLILILIFYFSGRCIW